MATYQPVCSRALVFGVGCDGGVRREQRKRAAGERKRANAWVGMEGGRGGGAMEGNTERERERNDGRNPD